MLTRVSLCVPIVISVTDTDMIDSVAECVPIDSVTDHFNFYLKKKLIWKNCDVKDQRF